MIEDQISDCYFEVNGYLPTKRMISDLKEKIPEDVLRLGEQWGWNDTEFANGVLRWLRSV